LFPVVKGCGGGLLEDLHIRLVNIVIVDWYVVIRFGIAFMAVIIVFRL
jgi:hypothetical protein